jgi:hypothetical protein
MSGSIFWFVSAGAVFCGACLMASCVLAQDEAPSGSLPQSGVHRKSPFVTEKFGNNERLYYASTWGVDMLKVSYTSSGNLIRFSYRVSEPQRARWLADKTATPYLMEPRSRAVLSVPVMDKIGALRQTAEPQSGQNYWMVFSNKGNLVRPGDRVNVVIGSFRADGLVVE